MAPPSSKSRIVDARRSHFGEPQEDTHTNPPVPARAADGHTRTLDGMSNTAGDCPESRGPSEGADFAETILFQLSDAVVAVDTRLRVTWWNKSAERLYGVTTEQAVGRPLAEVCGSWWAKPEDEKVASDRLATTGVWRRDMTHVGLDGRVIPLALSVSPLRDQSEAIIGYVAVIRNIAHRKEIEESLRRSEQRFRELVETFNVIAWEGDPRTFRTSYISPQVERLLGYTAEQCLADPDFWVNHLYPEDRPSILARARQAVAEGRQGELECRIVASDGRVLWVRNVARVLCDPAGVPNRLLGFSEDISARKEAEQALRKSQERLAEAQRIASLGSWEWDVPDNKVTWSDELFHLFGLTPQSFGATYEAFIRLVHPGDREYVMKTVDRALHYGEAYRMDFRVVRPDGVERTVHGEAQVLLDPSGRTIRIAGTLQDVTERKQIEEELRQLSGRLLQVQDEERRRIGRELHDTVGQTLTALNANLALVEESVTSLKPRVRESVTESRSLAQQCLEEVRTLSYLLYPPMLDEMGLGASLRWYVKGLARRSRIRVSLDIQAGLGRLPHEVETTLFRVVQECLTNIQRHSGSRTAGIRIARDSGSVRLEVTDQGCGMIIGPSSEANGAAPSLGVGIRSMRERMRHIGGRLEIDSSSKGTTVRAILPLSERRV